MVRSCEQHTLEAQHTLLRCSIANGAAQQFFIQQAIFVCSLGTIAQPVCCREVDCFGAVPTIAEPHVKTLRPRHDEFARVLCQPIDGDGRCDEVARVTLLCDLMQRTDRPAVVNDRLLECLGMGSWYSIPLLRLAAMMVIDRREKMILGVPCRSAP